jgi:DNA-binding LacI/PurR family transcriptional regulator
MEDIAKQLGVSTVTVSKALSGKDGVGDSLRAKIKALASEMGYVISPRMRDSKNKEPSDIGVLISYRFVSSKDSFYWQMYEKLVSRLQANDYYAILEILSTQDENAGILPRLLRRIGGLIVIGRLADGYLQHLKEFVTIPIIFLDSYDHTNYTNAVISNGYYGMYTMTNHLISMGHRDIVFVGSLEATSSISDRFFGFWRSMSEHNIPVDPRNCIRDREDDGLIRIKLPDVLPTAFACNCDNTAYVMIQALKERNIRVPEDVSVVGFDNCILSDYSEPTITTYAVDIDGMAFACVNSLIRKITTSYETDHIIVIDGKMIIKGSVAPPPRL